MYLSRLAIKNLYCCCLHTPLSSALKVSRDRKSRGDPERRWYSILNFRFYNYKERLPKTVHVFRKESKRRCIFLEKRRHPVVSRRKLNLLLTHCIYHHGAEAVPDVGHNILMYLCVCVVFDM